MFYERNNHLHSPTFIPSLSKINPNMSNKFVSKF